ncbi:MAG: M20/M25/M40 family metallo-hydrolase [Bacteroidota bacterium]|nr:M20/M25/M40 family metallo-hydrolase [Bacteroidota bacterium]
MSRLLLISCLVLFSAPAFSQNNVSLNASLKDSLFIRKLADEILVDGHAYSNLQNLTKTIGGRLSGSPQFYQAEVWAQQALHDAGAEKVYLQACMVPHWIRGGADTAAFTTLENKTLLRTRSLDILALGNSKGTGPQGITAPALLIHSFDELQRRKSDVKGKIVFYDYPFNERYVETFRAYSDAVPYRVTGPSNAARYGAVGVLVRSMSSSTDNNPHTGAMNYNDSFPQIPAAAVGLKDADSLAAALGKNAQVSVYLRTMAQMLPDTLAHNVIGELRGSVFPDQVILIGGHLDSWDPAEGAQDDGAGCVHAIEVLRVLKAVGYKPRHTIRVVLFANEENGGRGGKKYAEEVGAKKEKQLFALESDAGGFTPRCFSFSLPEAKLAAIRPWIRLLQPYGVYEFTSRGGGADVTPLVAQGFTVGELVPDSQRYFDYHHSRADVLEKVNKRELELGAVSMAALVYLVDKYGFTPSP